MILVDTCIWSLALRRSRRDLSADERHLVFRWRELLAEGDAALIGPIRQELLSGIPSETQFRELRKQIEPHADLPLGISTWCLAAEFSNSCRSSGVAAQAIDMTICAAAYEHGAAIFTVDPDFHHYAGLLPIRLFKP